MKKILAFLFVLVSGSAFAGEISETQCLVQYDAKSGMLILNNEIEPMQPTYEMNCLDLAKVMSKAEINGQTVAGIQLIYKNPVR